MIRPAGDADGEGIAALIAGVFAEYPGCVFDWSEFPELRRPASAFTELGGAIWVAEAGRDLVGSVATAPGPEAGDYELFKLYVARPHRGSGLAARLLNTALTYARARGARRMALWSDTRFLAGHRFYEKQGFTRLPGHRVLNDLSASSEYSFALDLAAPGGLPAGDTP